MPRKKAARPDAIKLAGVPPQVLEARERLLPFVRLMMPDPEDYDNFAKTSYQTQNFHAIIAEALERVERGELKRLAISVPPQHGKSQLCSRMFPAWYMGRHPDRALFFAAYSNEFSGEFGAEARDLFKFDRYQLVFPDMVLQEGSQARSYMVTKQRGRLAFIGRKGAGTGKPADMIIIDDPIKNAEEAESPTTRRALHEWFSKVVFSRAKNNTGIVIIQTRWHEDDLIGRLCDPDHPNYDKELAGEWTYVNIPAVVQEGPIATILNLKPEPSTDPLVVSQFGAGPIASLWPERFSLRHLATAKKMNPLGFDALYQGKPSPDDGEYFRAEWLVEYDKGDLPDDLRYYGASDHAVDEKQRSDKNVIGCIGLDANDTIWVMPDVVMAKGETDVAVEDIIAQMQRYKPFSWYMESELISKSFGPFLRKRMEETKTYCHIQTMPVTKRKEVRARAIQGRLAMKKVRFPKFAPWWREARAQLLKFPFGAHDDFVDWLAHFGMGLSTQISAETTEPAPDERVVRVGSIEWIMRKAALRARMEQRQKAAAGW